jgi:hypothetical protein
MVVARAGEALVPHLLGEGRSILPYLSEVMWNSSAETPVMARSGDGGPPRAELMTMESEPSPMGERLRPPKWLAMNSKLQSEWFHRGRSHRMTGVHHQ